MPRKIYDLKERVVNSLPDGQLAWKVFGRLMAKTGISWSAIDENTEVTPEQYEKALKAVEDLENLVKL